MPSFTAQVIGQALGRPRAQAASVHAAYGGRAAGAAPSFERYL